MFCRNCGCKNEEEDVFCGACGTKLILESGEEEPNLRTTNQTRQQQSAAAMIHAVKAIPKKALIGIALAIAAITAIYFLIANANATINLDKYVNVTFEGYNGYGRASAEIDWEGIKDKYGSKLTYKKKAFSDYGSSLQYYHPVDFMNEYVTVSIDKTSQLSNENAVKYTWNIDEEALTEYLKCKIKFEDKTITVSGLEEIDTFDPFSDVTVTYSGVAPMGTASIEYHGAIFDTYDFNCDKDSGLSNGDTLTINLKVYDMGKIAESYGRIPSVTEKTYTVDGLGTYASSISELDAAAVAAMKSTAEEIILEYTSGWTFEKGIDSVKYVGDYLQVAKDASEYTRNIYGLVYEINSHVQASPDYDAVNVVQYYDVRFENIIVNQDSGCEVDLTAYSTPYEEFTKIAYYGEDFYSYDDYYYYGFEVLGHLKNIRVESIADAYDTEWNMEGGDNIDLSAENAADRLCPYSTEREITESEVLEFLNKDYSLYNFPGDRTIIQMIINEMYALKGYQFSDEGLYNYFSQKEWYQHIVNKTNDMDEIYKNMSSIEQANIALLQQYK